MISSLKLKVNDEKLCFQFIYTLLNLIFVSIYEINEFGISIIYNI